MLIGVCSQLVALAIIDGSLQRAAKSDYILIIDCGSSGTRMCVQCPFNASSETVRKQLAPETSFTHGVTQTYRGICASHAAPTCYTSAADAGMARYITAVCKFGMAFNAMAAQICVSVGMATREAPRGQAGASECGEEQKCVPHRAAIGSSDASGTPKCIAYFIGSQLALFASPGKRRSQGACNSSSDG